MILECFLFPPKADGGGLVVKQSIFKKRTGFGRSWGNSVLTDTRTVPTSWRVCGCKLLRGCVKGSPIYGQSDISVGSTRSRLQLYASRAAVYGQDRPLTAVGGCPQTNFSQHLGRTLLRKPTKPFSYTHSQSSKASGKPIPQ